jgi:multicomponent Na+:H+ antiporter subunit D
MIDWVHPGLVLILGAVLVPFLNGRAKKAYLIVLPTAALICCLLSSEGTFGNLSVLGYELVFGRVDRLSLIFSYVFSIMAVVGFVYALHVEDDGQHMAAPSASHSPGTSSPCSCSGKCWPFHLCSWCG